MYMIVSNKYSQIYLHSSKRRLYLNTASTKQPWTLRLRRGDDHAASVVSELSA